MEINLEKYINGDIVLSGRDRGKDLRKKLKMEKLEKENNTIKIIIPEEVCSLNSSYFLGLFGNSVRLFGETKFLQKYNFQCDQLIKENIMDGISSALKEGNALD